MDQNKLVILAQELCKQADAFSSLVKKVVEGDKSGLYLLDSLSSVGDACDEIHGFLTSDTDYYTFTNGTITLNELLCMFELIKKPAVPSPPQAKKYRPILTMEDTFKEELLDAFSVTENMEEFVVRLSEKDQASPAAIELLSLIKVADPTDEQLIRSVDLIVALAKDPEVDKDAFQLHFTLWERTIKLVYPKYGEEEEEDEEKDRKGAWRRLQILTSSV